MTIVRYKLLPFGYCSKLLTGPGTNVANKPIIDWYLAADKPTVNQLLTGPWQLIKPNVNCCRI